MYMKITSKKCTIESKSRLGEVRRGLKFGSVFCCPQNVCGVIELRTM